MTSIPSGSQAPLPKPSRIPAEYPPMCRRFAPSPDPQLTAAQVTTREIRRQDWARFSRPTGSLGDTGEDTRGYPDSCTSRPTGVPLPQQNPARLPIESPRIDLELQWPFPASGRPACLKGPYRLSPRPGRPAAPGMGSPRFCRVVTSRVAEDIRSRVFAELI